MSSRAVVPSWLLTRQLKTPEQQHSASAAAALTPTTTTTTAATTAGAVPFFFSSLGGGSGGRGGTGREHNDPHSALSGVHLMTLARLWAMWRAISWLNAHKQFMGLGVVLAEYATKSALSYLPHEQQYRCERLLSMVGLDIEKVGLDTVGQSALSVAMTGRGFDAMVVESANNNNDNTRDDETGGRSTHCQRFDVERLMREIVHIASMPPSLEGARHVRCADRLRGGWSMQRAAVDAYGARDAVWAKGGLRVWSAPDRAPYVTCNDVQAAYTAWWQHSVKAAEVVRRLGPSALRAMAPI